MQMNLSSFGFIREIIEMPIFDVKRTVQLSLDDFDRSFYCFMTKKTWKSKGEHHFSCIYSFCKDDKFKL